jgi:D-alanyl-lipoteichoic acid acyltransferase DltB (MBOAT superfamily)
VDGVAFYHLILGRKKAGDLFQISCSVCRCVSGGYLVVKVRDKLTRCEADKLKFSQFFISVFFLFQLINRPIVEITKINADVREKIPSVTTNMINVANGI